MVKIFARSQDQKVQACLNDGCRSKLKAILRKSVHDSDNGFILRAWTFISLLTFMTRIHTGVIKHSYQHCKTEILWKNTVNQTVQSVLVMGWCWMALWNLYWQLFAKHLYFFSFLIIKAILLPSAIQKALRRY